MRNKHGHTTTGYEPVCMQAREIKAKVEITKQECEVKTVGNVCGLREVSKLGSNIAMNARPSATIRGSSG
jgi:hypothetical protein